MGAVCQWPSCPSSSQRSVKPPITSWQFWFALVCGVGAFREAYFHLVYEPLRATPAPRIGSEFETLRPLVARYARIGYISDEPLDADPTLPREHGRGDLMYAAAQYALAPTILAHAERTSPVVLANFQLAAGLERLLSSGEFIVIRRPAPNIALLRRR